jgi:hypothetical protein
MKRRVWVASMGMWCALWVSACSCSETPGDPGDHDASAGGNATGGRGAGGARSGGAPNGDTGGASNGGAAQSGGAPQSSGGNGAGSTPVGNGGTAPLDASSDATDDASSDEGGRDASVDGSTGVPPDPGGPDGGIDSGTADSGGAPPSCGLDHTGTGTAPRDPVIGCSALSVGTTATWQIVTTPGNSGIGGVSAMRLSADGSTLVTTYLPPGDSTITGFTWRPAEGITPIASGFHPTGASCDGSVVVGNNMSERWPYRWTRGGNVQPLPRAGNVEALVNAVSADGRTMAGGVYAKNDLVARSAIWTQAGAQATVAIGLEDGAATLISSAGDLVLGIDQPAGAAQHFCSWVAGRCQVLDLGGVFAESLSADGKVAFGTYRRAVAGGSTSGPRRWIAPSCVTDMPCPTGTGYCAPATVSSRGHYFTVVAENKQGRTLTFLWDAAHGYRDLKQLFIAHGATIAASDDVSILDMSDDGVVFAGLVGPDGTRMQIFRGTLPRSIYD